MSYVGPSASGTLLLKGRPRGDVVAGRFSGGCPTQDKHGGPQVPLKDPSHPKKQNYLSFLLPQRAVQAQKSPKKRIALSKTVGAVSGKFVCDTVTTKKSGLTVTQISGKNDRPGVSSHTENFLDRLLWKYKARKTFGSASSTSNTKKIQFNSHESLETSPVGQKGHPLRHTTGEDITKPQNTHHKRTSQGSNSTCIVETAHSGINDSPIDHQHGAFVSPSAEFGLFEDGSDLSLQKRIGRCLDFHLSVPELNHVFQYTQPASPSAPNDLQSEIDTLTAATSATQALTDSILIHNFLLHVETERIQAAMATAALLLPPAPSPLSQ